MKQHRPAGRRFRIELVIGAPCRLRSEGTRAAGRGFLHAHFPPLSHDHLRARFMISLRALLRRGGGVVHGTVQDLEAQAVPAEKNKNNNVNSRHVSKLQANENKQEFELQTFCHPRLDFVIRAWAM